MDQLVREETQRLLSNQMREAKLQRQIQVKLTIRQLEACLMIDKYELV